MKEFDFLISLIKEKAGLAFEHDRIPHYINKIEKRIYELNFTAPSDYSNFLIYHDKDNQEFKTLINALTNNETFFFRHSAHFNILRNTVIPEICRHNQKLKKPRRTFKIWSAACSNGSETYSIAITLFELFSYLKSCGGFDSVEIFGTDIDTDIISNAEKALYNERCVKTEMPEEYLMKYFSLNQEGKYKLKNDIKNMVIFKNLNLINDSFPLDSDVVFCRNVLYYFDIKVQKFILKKIYNSLKPSGYLFLGGTESVNSPEFFETCNDLDSFYYKKWTTDRRIFEDKTSLNKRLRSSANQKEPRIDFAHSSNTISFSGVFADNCKSEKLLQNFYYNLILLDPHKTELKIINRNFKILTLDFSKICWISNEMLYEIKKWLFFLKEKNYKINIICEKNITIYNWLLKSNFKEVSNIYKESENYFNPVNLNNILSIEKKSASSSSENLNFEKNLLSNNKINSYSENPNKSNETILYIYKCDESELENLKSVIRSSINLNKKLIVNLKHSVYLNNKLFEIIHSSQNYIKDSGLIEIVE